MVQSGRSQRNCVNGRDAEKGRNEGTRGKGGEGLKVGRGKGREGSKVGRGKGREIKKGT